MLFAAVAFLLEGCITPQPSSTTISAIEESGKLIGVEQIMLKNDDSVILTAGKCTPHLVMRDGSGRDVNSATLKVGQECQFSDFRHVTIKYKLVDIKEGTLYFLVTDTFNAISFGGAVETWAKTVAILPYAEQTEFQ